ncbi:gustatory receptor for sugar taste 64e-like isoform X2 [Cylas formicarius]|uniref:gustatory receptor for sugar taste 64e-like isoform X2 n=1 Tax=Cylas formicarius TaxID=197179 RepID=UPI00295883E9|nr:gustatory receptor for sugar taste 64e-like isoform X2 [Cylas formicarius]
MRSNIMYYIAKNNKIEGFAVENLLGKENMYTSLKNFMFFSQFLGIFPQKSVRDGEDRIHFSWLSLKVLYTLVYIGFLSVTVVCYIIHIFRAETDIIAIATLVFYTVSLLIMILYLKLARVWPDFIRKWCAVDKLTVVNYGYPKKVLRRLRFFIIVYVILALTNNVLRACNRYDKLRLSLKENYTVDAYYKASTTEVFRCMRSSTVSGIMAIVINLHTSLLWACNDLFIIVVSVVLASRFRMLSQKLFRECQKNQPLHFFQTIREDYDRLANLCYDLDSNITGLILLSYFLNIFFILVQLYRSFELKKSTAFSKIFTLFFPLSIASSRLRQYRFARPGLMTKVKFPGKYLIQCHLMLTTSR